MSKSAFAPRGPPLGEVPDDSWLVRVGIPLVKNLLIFAVTLYVIVAADVLGVMYASRKIYRPVLYASMTCHAVFAGIGIWLSFIVSRYNPKWEETHMRYIHVATGAVVLGGLLWMIALWPVFHAWTLLLAVAAIFCCLSFLTFIPGTKAKKD